MLVHPIVFHYFRRLPLLLVALVLMPGVTPGDEAAWGSPVKLAAKNAGSKKVEKGVENAVAGAIEKATSKSEDTMTTKEKRAAVAEKLAALNLDTDSVKVPRLDFSRDFARSSFVRKTLKKKPMVVVPGYRVVFSLDNAEYVGVAGDEGASPEASRFEALALTTSATVGGITDRTSRETGNTRILARKAILDGVTLQDLQQIADQAYIHFLEELEASGYDYVTTQDFVELEAFKEIELTKPRSAEPYVQSGDERSRSTYAVFAPSGLPLWFSHYDHSLGLRDKEPHDQRNWRALNALSAKTNAVVLVPQIGINFARMEDAPTYSLLAVGSGNFDFNVNVHLDPRVTSLSAYSAKTETAGSLGAATLRKPVFLPYEFGVVEKIILTINRGVPRIKMREAYSSAYVREVYAVTGQTQSLPNLGHQCRESS